MRIITFYVRTFVFFSPLVTCLFRFVVSLSLLVVSIFFVIPFSSRLVDALCFTISFSGHWQPWKYFSHHFTRSRNHDEDDGLTPSAVNDAEFQMKGEEEKKRATGGRSRTAHHGTHFKVRRDQLILSLR